MGHLYPQEIGGYEYKGTSKNELWGVWAKTTKQKAGDASAQPAPIPYHRNDSPLLERSAKNWLYTKLIQSLDGLNQTHQDHLSKRGIDVDLALRLGYRSITTHQPLSISLPPTLPGVDKDGKHLASKPGYLCPALDAVGNLVAFQVRTDPESNAPKYIWLNAGQNLYINKSDELPLSVVNFSSRSTECISLCEGIGAKPFLLAHHYQCVAIGAAGGMHSSSRNELTHTLKHLGARQVWLWPDAGCSVNDHVLRQYFNTLHLLQSQGLEIKITWWNQHTKDHPDCDEDFSLKFELLSPDQFWQTIKEFTLPSVVQLAQSTGLSSLPLWLKSKKPEQFSAIELAYALRHLRQVEATAKLMSSIVLLMAQLRLTWDSPHISRWLASIHKTPKNLTPSEQHKLLLALQKAKTKLES